MTVGKGLTIADRRLTHWKVEGGVAVGTCFLDLGMSKIYVRKWFFYGSVAQEFAPLSLGGLGATRTLY